MNQDAPGLRRLIAGRIRHLAQDWRMYCYQVEYKDFIRWKVECRTADPVTGWDIWAPCNHGNAILRKALTPGTEEHKLAKLLDD